MNICNKCGFTCENYSFCDICKKKMTKITTPKSISKINYNQRERQFGAERQDIQYEGGYIE